LLSPPESFVITSFARAALISSRPYRTIKLMDALTTSPLDRPVPNMERVGLAGKGLTTRHN
jgi:hypothetical protein